MYKKAIFLLKNGKNRHRLEIPGSASRPPMASSGWEFRPRTPANPHPLEKSWLRHWLLLSISFRSFETLHHDLRCKRVHLCSVTSNIKSYLVLIKFLVQNLTHVNYKLSLEISTASRQNISMSMKLSTFHFQSDVTKFPSMSLPAKKDKNRLKRHVSQRQITA